MQFKNTYIAHINGLRAIAVLLVYLFHLEPAVFKSGFLGVDIFFVISGFLITRSICRSIETGSFSIKSFYFRRFKRLFPALFAMLIGSTVLATLVLDSKAYLHYLKTLRYSSFQLSNFFFARKVDYFGIGNDSQFLLHTWSLSVEEQFYIFWPLVIVLMLKLFKGSYKKLFHSFFLLAITSYVLGFAIAKSDINTAYYMFYTRAWEFCIGAFAVFLTGEKIQKSKRLASLSIPSLFILIAFSVFVNPSKLDFEVIYLVPCLLTLLLIITRGTLAHKFLEAKPFMYLGDRSYSIYLWHWPVICFFNILSVNQMNIGLMFIVTAITLIASEISYNFVEKKIRFFKPSLSVANFKKYENKFLLVCFFLMCSGVILAKSLKNFSENQTRLTYLSGVENINIVEDIKREKEAYIKKLRKNYSPYKNKSDISVLGSACSFNGKNVSKKNTLLIAKCLEKNMGKEGGVLVVGDSHGRDFFHILKAKFPDKKIGMLHNSACVPYGYNKKYTKNGECFPSFDTFIENYVVPLKPKYVFLSSKYNRKKIKHVKEAISRLSYLDSQIYLVGPSPYLVADIKKIIQFRYKAGKDVDICNFSRINIPLIEESLKKYTDSVKKPNVTYLDKMSLLKSKEGVCLAFVPKMPNKTMYIDDSHLSISAINYLAESLELQLL